MMLAAPRRSEGDKAHESRQPREGPADPSALEDPETQAGRDVKPPKACEGIPREHKAVAKAGGRECSGGMKLKKASTRRILRGPEGQNEPVAGSRP